MQLCQIRVFPRSQKKIEVLIVVDRSLKSKASTEMPPNCTVDQSQTGGPSPSEFHKVDSLSTQLFACLF